MAENVSVHESLNPETTTEQGKLIKAQPSWESSPRRVTKGLPGDSVGRSQNWQVHSRCRGEVSKTSRKTPSRGQKDTDMNQLRIPFKCGMDTCTLKRQNCSVEPKRDGVRPEELQEGQFKLKPWAQEEGRVPDCAAS